jgi:hypothetical protein
MYVCMYVCVTYISHTYIGPYGASPVRSSQFKVGGWGSTYVQQQCVHDEGHILRAQDGMGNGGPRLKRWCVTE